MRSPQSDPRAAVAAASDRWLADGARTGSARADDVFGSPPPALDVMTLIRIVLRQWMIVLALLALTATAAYEVHRRTDPVFEADGSVVLVGGGPPEEGPVAGSVIADVVQGEAFRARLQAGTTATYAVQADGDLLEVTTIADAEGEAVRLAEDVLTAIDDEVELRQKALGLAEEERVGLEVTGPPTVGVVAGPDERPRYAASGSAVLSSPGIGANLFGSSQFSGRLVEEIMEGDPARAQIRQRGGYGFDLDVDRRGPLLTVTTTGPSAGAAIETFDHVATVMDEELEGRQRAIGVPKGNRTRAYVLVAPVSAENRTKTLSRGLVGVLALGVAAAVAAAVAAESIKSGLRRRGNERQPAPVPAVNSPPLVGRSAVAEPPRRSIEHPPSRAAPEAQEPPTGRSAGQTFPDRFHTPASGGRDRLSPPSAATNGDPPATATRPYGHQSHASHAEPWPPRSRAGQAAPGHEGWDRDPVASVRDWLSQRLLDAATSGTDADADAGGPSGAPAVPDRWRQSAGTDAPPSGS
ncbi:MAG TPA: hypothetical protein VHF25_15800 [Nitriliruptorales bacterium]|nr:hypothetical protein [Nitriliruptorales bacterium]